MAQIFVFDRDRAQGKWARRVLEGRDHEVTLVRAVHEAKALIGEPCDLWVIADEPQGRSLELIARLRKHASEQHLPILLLLVSDSEDEVLRGFAAGASAVIAQALTQAKLVSHVQRLLSQKVALTTRELNVKRGQLVCAHYEVQGAIGRGANATVFKALDTRSQDMVALKIASGDMEQEPESQQRHQREAYSLLAVKCAFTPRLIEIGRWEDRDFMAMELVRGPTLDRHVERFGSLSLDEGLGLLRGLTRALVSLQEHGLVHRDLKPSNVVLRNGNPSTPVLIDFGLVRSPSQTFLTDADVVLGTVGYLAPEYVRGKPMTMSSDLFSLGHVVCFALSAELAWSNLKGYDLMKRQACVTYTVPDTVPGELRGVLQCLVQVKPKHRPATAAALLELLDGAEEHLGADAVLDAIGG